MGLLVYAPVPGAARAVHHSRASRGSPSSGLPSPRLSIERLRFRDALVRGRQLGLADYFHALGSLASLVIVVGVAETALAALLHTQSDNSARVALFLADLVLSPLLFLGGALLYQDQAARVGSR